MSEHPSPAFDQGLSVDLISASAAASAHVLRSSPSSTIRPLPFLPMELKREIVLYCDPPTLAAMSRASLALFELAAPVLYRDVTVEGIDGLRRMLLPREPDVNADVVRFPHLSASLDLGQITTFTFISRDDRDKEACPDMLPSWERSLSSVMERFDPINCAFSAVPADSFAYTEIGYPAWTRLETLSYADTGPVNYTVVTAFREGPSPIKVVYDLQRTHFSIGRPYFSNYERNVLDDVLGGDDPDGAEFDTNHALVESARVPYIVLRVTGETQARQIWSRTRAVWSENDIDDELQDRWAAKLVFKLVDKNDRYRFVRKSGVKMADPEHDLVKVS